MKNARFIYDNILANENCWSNVNTFLFVPCNAKEQSLCCSLLNLPLVGKPCSVSRIPQQLGEQTKLYKTQGDGNCLFWVISYSVARRQVPKGENYSLYCKYQLLKYKPWDTVLQVSKFQHITPVLCALHWLPIQYRIIFKILLVVYKSLNGTSPSYLAQKLHYRSHSRSLRSVSNELLMQPRSYTKTYGDRAFAVHAPREWNLIPYEIRKSNTISSFKRSLKTYLFTKFSDNGSLFL